MKTYVRNNRQQIIGYYISYSTAIYAYNSQNQYVGRFLITSNITLDSNGILIGHGNHLRSLF